MSVSSWLPAVLKRFSVLHTLPTRAMDEECITEEIAWQDLVQFRWYLLLRHVCLLE